MDSLPLTSWVAFPFLRGEGGGVESLLLDTVAIIYFFLGEGYNDVCGVGGGEAIGSCHAICRGPKVGTQQESGGCE